MNVESHVSTFAIRLVAIFALLAATMLGTAQAEVKDEIIFFHVNAVGSATAAFNEAGDLCWKQDYTPYGEQTKNDDASPVDGCGLIGKDRGFTGHTQDESGLTYMQQRYYDASIGRFLSVDPMGVNAENANSYNRYMYGNNNPYKYIDPDGRVAFLAFVPPLLKAIDVAITAAEVTAAAQSGGATAAAGVLAESAATSVIPGGKIISKVAGATKPGAKALRKGDEKPDNPTNPETISVTKDGVAFVDSKYKIPDKYVQNPHGRTGSFGEITNGKFKERLRIDQATPTDKKGPNYSHYHKDGRKPHYSPRNNDRDPGF